MQQLLLILIFIVELAAQVGGEVTPGIKSCNQNSRISFKKLWENPDLSSSFSAQVITVDLQKYLFVVVQYWESVSGVGSSNNLGTATILKGTKAIVYHTRYSGGDKSPIGRVITTSNSGVYFSTGYKTIINTTARQTADDTVIIPSIIYGVL